MNEEDILKKIEEYRGIIGRVLEAFKGISFPIIVEVATNTKVQPFNLGIEEDIKLVEELSKLADITIKKFYENPIQIKRINEVSNLLEKEFPKIFNANKDKFKVLKSVEHLGGMGYPDEKVQDVFGRTTYIDIKGTTRPETGSARDFYFTPLTEAKKKIKVNGRHALSSFIISGTPNAFKTIGWKLVDLSKIKVSMKPEFNADNKELYRKETIIAERYISKS
jgi:hypothetical protein